MKITGTKKLLIILFALTCALAVGLGVMFTRTAFDNGVGVAYAGTELPSVGEEDASSDGEEEISDAENNEEEEAEEAYDPRFDEGVIAEIAERIGYRADLLNLYLRVNNFDANEILQYVKEAQEAEALIGDEGGFLLNPEEAESGVSEDTKALNELNKKASFIGELIDDIIAFNEEYENGKVDVSEDDKNKSWYVSPDDYSSYVGSATSVRYIGYNNSNYNTYSMSYNFWTSRDGGATWTVFTPSWTWYCDPVGSNFRGWSWETSPGSGVYDQVYHHYGQRMVVTLDPGEQLYIECAHKSNSNGQMAGDGYGGNATGHFTNILNQNWTANSKSHYVIDGDAPTGSEMVVYNNLGNDPVAHTGENGYWTFFTYAHATVNGRYNPSSNGATYASMAIKYRIFNLIVKRNPLTKPVLVDDGSGDVNIPAGTKSSYYEGQPVTITMSPDFGAALMEYAFYKDASCTVPDDSVALELRSQHGVEGCDGANITFRSSVAGKHYIRLRLIQPQAYQGTYPSFGSTAITWADGTNSAITFMLEIKLQRTSRPQVVYDEGVAANGKSKTVNYTGEEQTVTFTSADKSLISWSSNGMIEDSWDEDSKTLVLKQTERGTYTINLYITNTAGCVWSDTGTTEMIQFTFYIKEMLIERTLNLEDPSVFNIHEKYTGVEHVLEVGPAVNGQLIIIAPGVNYSYLEREVDGETLSYIRFSMVDSGTQDILIRPAKGYIWKDSKDQATITFNITIDAVAISFPRLVKEDGFEYADEIKYGDYSGYRTKNMVFNPTYGWKGTIIIENIPKQAISELGLNTAMEIVSWLPSDKWYEDHPDETPLDIDCTVLTLGAVNANTYPVIISITDPNFTWETATNPPTFNLFIDRYELYAPHIAGDVRSEWGGAIEKNPAISDSPFSEFVEPDFDTVYPGSEGQKKIEGLTKTVYFNIDPAAGNATPNVEKYFRLYAGGFTSNNQVTIEYSKSGLAATWPYDSDGIPFLNLQGSHAGNYIINITPTSNYRWTDGSTSMRTFKFVIIPIIRDSLEMFKETDDGNSWAPVATFDTSVTYNGEQHLFRIGNPDNPSQNYDGTQMTYALVDQAYNTIQPVNYPDGFTITQRVVNGVNILEGTAVHAGVYIIRLKLNSEDYAWRQGQGIDMYYTFRVEAKKLKNPVLMADECSGGAGQKVEVVDDEYNHYVYGGYNGNDFQMVIGFVLDGLDPNEIILDYNPSGIDFDPDTSDPAFWGSFNASIDDVGITRLYAKAKIVGTHTLHIQLKNKDYSWASNTKYYEFQLIIDFAQVEFVNFGYGDADAATPIGSDGSSYVVDYDPDPEKLHNIVVTRADNDFDSTPFESMFRFEVAYNKPDYEYEEDTYNFDNLVLSFKDANTYYINIYLTSNYTWKKERNRPNTLPVRMTFTVNPKAVDIPMIIDEEEKDENGNSIAYVDNSTLTKTVTYDTNTIQSIALNLGDDFRAFEVNAVQTTSFLNADPNVTPLKDKKFRYTAKSAGTYVLVIQLSDTNNYSWVGGTSVTYTLKIDPRTIDVPDAFFIHNKDINDPHFDYAMIQGLGDYTPVDGKGKINEDIATGRYEVKEKYTGELQYIYLFGYAVENSEVNISVVASDTSNAADLGHLDVSVGGDVKGHFVYAKYVNVYTITVEFKLSAEFSTPNCHWQSISMGTDVLPRQFYLEIEKKAVDLPYLVADPAQAWAMDDYGFDSLTQKFTYDGANNGPSIEIANCLDSSPIKFMEYGKVNGLTDYRLDTSGTHILTFFIMNTATVGTEYKLRIALDTANECWNTTVPDDIADRYIYIVIEKKGITRPDMVIESDGATYSTTVFNNDTKTFTYDGTAWPSAMKISGIDLKWMSYSNSQPNNLMSSEMISGELVVSALSADSDTYSVVVTLRDDVNLKWDGTADDSDPAEFMLVIAPKQYARPVIDSLLCKYDAADFTAGLVTINAEDMTTTYLYGLIQKFVIANYIDDKDIMTVDISTGKAFDNRVNVNENGSGTLTYGAEGAGVYVVVIKPSKNATWATGDPGDITFTLTINKRQHTAPTLDMTDASTTPPVIAYTNPKGYLANDGTTVINDTKTLTYILNTLQSIVINGYDGGVVMQIIPTGFDSADNLTPIVSDVITYWAKNAGTYTVEIKIRDDLSANNCFDDAAKSISLTFTFVIEKQKLDAPVFDDDAALLQNAPNTSDESVNTSGNTFEVTYDGTRHANILLNVLGEDYMTFKVPDGSNYNDGLVADKQFKFETTPNTTKIVAGASLDGIYRNGEDLKPFLTAMSPLVSGVDKENYIRLDAIEPGTYQLIFTLKNTDNFVWSDSTNTPKTVTFTVKKVRVAAPDYTVPANSSKPYEGKAVTFEIRNVFGAEGNGLTYTPTAPTYFFETVTAAPNVAGNNNEMKIVSLDTTTGILKVSAVEIGTYTVTISIKESEKSHVEWTTSGVTTKSFIFTITKRPIQPQITFGEATNKDGNPNTALNAQLAGPGPIQWPKDVTVSAIVTFPNISVTKDASNNNVLDLDLPFEIYYVNLASASNKVNALPHIDDAVKSALKNAPQTLTTVGANPIPYLASDTNGYNVYLMPDGTYNLVYKYKIVPGNTDNEMVMGSYRVYVDASTFVSSKSYTFVNNNANFAIEALKAPFDQTDIVLELYYLSDPDTVIKTYTLSDVFPTDPTKVWTDWTSTTVAPAIELDYLEKDDDYGFRFALKNQAMYGPAPAAGNLPDGETTFDQTTNPANSVLEALNRWQVKWTTNGTYGGKPTARYAGDYSFTVTIAALDSLKFSYATTTFEFFYKIKPVLYDISNLYWNYTTGTTQYIYDGTAKTVELVGTFPDGLTVGSYIVAGFDRNSQISAKYDPLDPTDPTTNYNTCVKFVNSNPNYVTPDMNDPSTYIYQVGGIDAPFPWTVVWSIEKKQITDLWSNTLNNDGSASAYIPKLTTHGSKVDYKYYIDAGGGVWNEVTSFEHTGTVNFKVVATLKSNSTDPALDYASNYDLVITNSDVGTTDTLTFTLGPGSGVTVDVVIRFGDAEQSTLTGGDPSPAALPSNNVFVYDGDVFSATLTNFTVAGLSTINDSNLILTYYNVSNKFRPIAAPTEPGHYMIKLQFTDLPDDGNDYTLQFTEFYFDIEKGTFDPNDIYWRYTHTDSNGFYTEAKWDDGLGKWIVIRDTDSTWDGTQWLGGQAGMAIDFVYDGTDHKVELFYGPSADTPPDNSLLVNMKSGSVYIDANTEANPKYKAVASFSFNGKLWNEPTMPMEKEWQIEKATVDLTTMYWDYPVTGFTYTRVDGEEKGFNVIMKDVNPLIANYIDYKFYRELEGDNGLEYKLQDNATLLSLFTQAGNYRTQFVIRESFAEENTNYKLGPNPLADPTSDNNPKGLISTLDWSINTRVIDVPDSSGNWTEFDGKEHNLLTAFNIQTDWEEYYSIKVQYKAAVGGTTFEDYNEQAIAEFGGEFSAMHAGDYKLLFRINDGINVADMQPNVQWRRTTTDTSISTYPYEFIDKDYVNYEYLISSTITIARAEMTVDYWVQNDEASTVALTTTSGLNASNLNQYVDYVFYTDDGVSPITTILAGTPHNIDYVLENPGMYAIKVYVVGEYKDKDPNYDINDFTNDIEVKAGSSAGQEEYYQFSMLTTGGTPASQHVIPKLVYIAGYSEAKDSGTVYHEFTYEEWQEMMVKQGIVDPNAAGFDWSDVLGPDPAEDEDVYKKFHDATVEGTTYDLEAQLKIAEYKSKVAVDVIYGGFPITFHVNGWDENGVNYLIDDPATVPPATPEKILENVKFVDYLDIWQGEFTHNEVGRYSATLLLKKTTGDDLCWSFEDKSPDGGVTPPDGIIDASEADRSSVKLVYSISYRTLNPHADAIAKHLPTYNGSEFNILHYAWDLEYGEGGCDSILTDEFKDYVEITGTTATAVGKYTVYLKIKDEYFNTIRWFVKDNPKGQPGTFKIQWEILPIYVEVPHKNDSKDAKIVYDGEGHSVFEVLEGYNGGNFADDSKLGVLLQVTTISNDRGINATVDKDGKTLVGASSYTTVFRLPDTNYAWIDSSYIGEEPKIDKENPERSIMWDIYQKELDLSKIAWGYVDDDGEEHAVEIVDNNKAQFQYTIKDGEVQENELILINIPDEIADVITYLTDGVEGSSRTNIGNYHTIVFLQGRDIDTNNYSYSIPEDFKNKYTSTTDGSYEIDWKIIERRFNVPENCEVPFDGTVREILDLFTNADGTKIFGEGWDNYIDITIEYKPLDAGDGEYVNYYDMASVDGKLDYSMYNAFYLGNYRVKFSIKSGLNATSDCVVWMNGAEKEVVNQEAVLTITPLELVIDGWKADPDNAQSYVIDSAQYDALSPEAKEVFKYVIIEQATGKPVDAKDIASRGAGIYYTIEFVIADGNDYAMDLGIKIVCASGVDNPYEFCTDNYPASQTGDVKYWLPKMQYTPTTTETYNGVAKEYTITNWSDYEIPASFAAAVTDVDLTGKTHFVELAGVICDNPDFASSVKFDATTGKITIGKAGNFTLNFRFIPDLNLSWFDSPYTFDGTNLKDGLGVNVTNTTTPSLDDLTDKHAQSINISIEKASVPQITSAQLDYYASLIKDVEFTGYEINLMEREDTKVLFEILKTSYGSLIEFEGYKATAAGEYKLVIKLKDKESSYWNLNIKEEIVVNDASYAEYDASYSLMWIEEGGKWIVAYAKPDGKGGYIKYNGGDYKLEIVYKMEKLIDTYVEVGDILDEDGRPETESGAKYVVDENGIAIRYSLVEGAYVEDAEGNYLAKYKLMADGTIMEMPVLGEGNRAVIDAEKSVVKIVRDVISTDPYEITWRITEEKLATPTVNENIVLTYNGKEQSAESVLKGFSSTFMEIVEGGVGKNAGEYTAKIKVKDSNHEWSDPEETDEDGISYVYVTWKIEKADVDLSNAQWIFTDGTNVYENGNGMVYTRKGGEAVVYWAELVNVPEALVGSIRYTTNGVVGAYAGRDAGKYKTSFEIVDADSNFNTITKPDTLAEEVTWNIQRRMLEIPSALGSLRFIFDDEPHDLLKMLSLQEDWSEYFTIEVMYAKNFVVYTKYEGHDGNPYEAYGAGGYKFVFDIISGINKSKDNPNVVWLRSNGNVEVPIVENNGTEEVEEQAATVKTLKKAPVTLAEAEEVVETVSETVETTCAEQVKPCETHTVNHTPTVVDVVCDRLRKLAYGAEIQLKSRKYLR